LKNRFLHFPAQIQLHLLDHHFCREKIRQSLKLTGLDIFFDNNIFSLYDVQSWKPEPGLFIHAAQAMGYSPSDCIVIEDSEVGLAAAEAAGMHAVLYNPFGERESVHELRSMSDLPELIGAVSVRSFSANP